MRSESARLTDILSSIHSIRRHIRPFESAIQLYESEQASPAVVYNLMIIGEAVKHLSDESRQPLPAMRWRKIAGLRDLIAHRYWTTDYEIVWDIVCRKISELESVVAMQLENRYPEEWDAFNEQNRNDG